MIDRLSLSLSMIAPLAPAASPADRACSAVCGAVWNRPRSCSSASRIQAPSKTSGGCKTAAATRRDERFENCSLSSELIEFIIRSMLSSIVGGAMTGSRLVAKMRKSDLTAWPLGDTPFQIRCPAARVADMTHPTRTMSCQARESGQICSLRGSTSTAWTLSIVQTKNGYETYSSPGTNAMRRQRCLATACLDIHMHGLTTPLPRSSTISDVWIRPASLMLSL